MQIKELENGTDGRDGIAQLDTDIENGLCDTKQGKESAEELRKKIQCMIRY